MGTLVYTTNPIYRNCLATITDIEQPTKGNSRRRYRVVIDGVERWFKFLDLMVRDEAIAPEPEDTNPVPKNFNRELTDSDYRDDLLKAQCQQDIRDLAEYLGEEQFTRIWESLDSSAQVTLNALPEFDSDD